MSGEKLEIVFVSFLGDVLSWFNNEIYKSNFVSWNKVKERLLVRFSREKL